MFQKISTYISNPNNIIIFGAFIITLMLASCHRPVASKNRSVEFRQDSLAFELCQIFGLDQGVRLSPGMKGKWDFILPIDTMNFYKIKDFIKVNGYPDTELLGLRNIKHECVDAAIVAVLLHSGHMLVNDKENFDFFLNEVEKGKMDRMFLAAVLDKYYVLKKDAEGNRRQLYGTTFGKPCLKYRKESDSVRATIGLKPLADSLFVKCK